MIDPSKDGVAKRMRELFKETGTTLEAMGEAGGGKTPQAAAKWLKTGRMSQDSIDKVADRYGYCSFWILTGHPPKKPTDIMDAEATTPAPPRTGKDVFAAAEPSAQYAGASEKARNLADTILAYSGSGSISDDVIDAIFTMVNATHAAVPDSLMDELKKHGGNKIKRRG